MLYLTALALIIALAVYLCARLFPRNHTTTTRSATTLDRQARQPGTDGHHARGTEGDQP